MRLLLICKCCFLAESFDKNTFASFNFFFFLKFSPVFLKRSMIPNTSLILYASVSKETTVLAKVSCDDGDLDTLASQCLENTPPFHRIYSHAAGERIYIFLIEDSLVYFAIFKESLGKPQGLDFLERVKNSFLKLLKNRRIDVSDDLTSHSLSEEFGPIFRYLIQMQPSEGEAPQRSPREVAAMDGQIDSSAASDNGIKVNVSCTEAPLLGRPNKYGRISRSVSGEEENGGATDFLTDNKVDVAIDGSTSREFGISMQKSLCCVRSAGQNQSRKAWRQHVRMVLLVDVVVCCVLFCIWLSICKGFRCIAH